MNTKQSPSKPDSHDMDICSNKAFNNQLKRVEQMNVVQREAADIFARKNADYGDAFAEYGSVGVLVRIGDKIKRFVNVSSAGVTLVSDEALRDTLLDLHNYAAMAVMLLDERVAK